MKNLIKDGKGWRNACFVKNEFVLSQGLTPMTCDPNSLIQYLDRIPLLLQSLSDLPDVVRATGFKDQDHL